MRNVSANYERTAHFKELGENRISDQELKLKRINKHLKNNQILRSKKFEPCHQNFCAKQIEVLLKVISQLVEALVSKLGNNTEASNGRTEVTPASNTSETTEASKPEEVTPTKPTEEAPEQSSIKESLAFVLSKKKVESLSASDLSDNTKVTEHDLYAAAIHNKMKNEHPEKLARFEKEFENRLLRLEIRTDKIKVRAAANRAIRGMVKSGLFTRSEAREIRQESFGKAQLDSDRSWLSRIRGADPEDAPVRNLSSALELFEANTGATDSEFEEFRSRRRERRRARRAKLNQSAGTNGSSHVGTNSVGSSSAPDNFIWKPMSESDGNLVILLPQNFTDNVAGVSVYGPDGEMLEEGRATGVANGGREHFRFSQPGENFPAGSEVVIRLSDGTTQKIVISDPSSRVG